MKGVLKSFQFPGESYAEDVAEILGDCIGRYGEREWRAVVLTNEIHGHLGIYSTLGAKMGVRAMEILGKLGANGHISVLSFAGSIPPVSCLNDGLQVSTGASMGHGLFAVAADKESSARARFNCGSHSLEMWLNPEFEDIIKADIKEGISLYGHSPEYWEHIRRLAIRYWRDWDRARIFSWRTAPQ